MSKFDSAKESWLQGISDKGLVMASRLPDFLIVGAQKCGTTWLHHQLATHPDIFLPEAKDHEFFSYTHQPSTEQVNAWSERYLNAADNQIIGDATASYFWSALHPPWHVQPEHFSPDIPKAINQTLGDNVKTIIILRNPVDRAISAYLHHISMGSLSADYSIFSASEKLGILSIGFFGQHLRHWLKYFPSDNVLVKNISIKNHHQQILDNVCDFLGLKKHAFKQSEQVVYRGMRRLRNEDGVWMRLQDIKDLSEINRAMPLISIDNEKYIRIIHPSELDQLKQLYISDQQLLNTLLEIRDQ